MRDKDREMPILNINYKAEIRKCKTMKDVVGKNGLLQRLLKDAIQNMLEAEMDEHLGREKYETVCNEVDNKVISMYAKGMSTRDIQSELQDIYGIDVSPSMISKITDKVMGAAFDWQKKSS